MSKKSKIKKQESVNEQDSVNEQAPESVAAPRAHEPEPAYHPASEVQYFKVEEVARRCCAGFQEHWVASIRSHAATLGLGEENTEDAWKSFLRHWGYRGDWLQ